MERHEKLMALEHDPVFIERMASVTTAEELKELFASCGVALTDSEINTIIDTAAQQAEGELDETALDDVVGGVSTAFLVSMGALYGLAWLIKKYGKTIIKRLPHVSGGKGPFLPI